MKIVKMTVITKPISGKKPDNLDVPLVENEQVEHLVSVQQALNRKDLLLGTLVFVMSLLWMKSQHQCSVSSIKMRIPGPKEGSFCTITYNKKYANCWTCCVVFHNATDTLYMFSYRGKMYDVA